MPLSTALSSQVSAAIRDRGRDYFRSGAVTLDAVTTHEVRATVAGGADYEVDLDLDGRRVFAYCTCPYVGEHGAVCKHIWATILAAEGRGFAATAAAAGRLQLVVDEDDAYDDAYDEYADPAPLYRHRPLPPAAPRRGDDWKNQLAALSREVQSPEPDYRRPARQAERQLLFVVDGMGSEEAKKLVLEINFQERKKNNEWGKPKAQTLTPAQVAALPDPGDRQVFALLGGAERGDGYGYYGGHYGYGVPRYRLVGPLLDAVLPLLAASGRIRLRRDSRTPVTLEDVAPDLDPPWTLAVGVTRDERKKQWVLSGNLRRGDRTMPVSEPVLVVPGLVFWEGRFTRLDDGGSFPWVPVLRRAGTIAVPAAKADEFLGQLLQMPRLPPLELPEELRYTEEAVVPRPRLVVKAAKQSYGGPMLNAELSFEYAGYVVPAGAPGRGVFRPDDKQFVLRDPEAEQAAAGQLARLGVRPGWSMGGQVLQLIHDPADGVYSVVGRIPAQPRTGP